MSRRAPSSGPARFSVLRGILLCARGRPEGIAQFGDTSQAFVSSLIPLIVFPLLRAVLLPAGDGLPRGTVLLATITWVLATAVLSHLMAQVFRQEPRWKRYATAVNWNNWILQFGVIVALVAATGLASAGMNPNIALIASFAALGAYALWLQFFLARHGLSLSRGRAVLLILAVNGGTTALVMVPELAWQAIDRAGAAPSAGGVQA
jgi:hypothetical protein